MKKLIGDEHGVAHLVLIVVGVVVIAGIGFAGWRVMGGKDKSADSTSSAANSETSKVAEAACKKLYDDDDLCKFASNVELSTASYKATFVTTDKDGKVSAFETSQDGKGNTSTVTKTGSAETGAFIMLNGDSYIKDVSDGSWTKYPKSPETEALDADPTEDLSVDFDKEEAKPEEQRVTYKKLDKEKCGNATCFKYQVIDPAQPNSESIIWFGDKDYVLRKWSFKDADGSTNVGEFAYTSVTISAPSPVKDAPAMPTEEDIQAQIDAATNAAQ